MCNNIACNRLEKIMLPKHFNTTTKQVMQIACTSITIDNSPLPPSSATSDMTGSMLKLLS